MTAWRNVTFSGFLGACLFAGCTVTTGGNTDGGVFDGTGGATGTGGAAATTGGSNTGGMTGPTTTVVECKPDYVGSPTARCGESDSQACDRCLQTYHCEAPYLECYVDAECNALLNAMMKCMVDQFDIHGETDPTVASETCQQRPDIAIFDPTPGTSQARASALWHEIEGSRDCITVCCGFVTHH